MKIYFLLLVAFAVSVNGHWTDLFKNRNREGLSRSKRQAVVLQNAIDIHRFEVTSSIVARFADTEVVSEIENIEEEAKEIVFQTQIPKNALVSNFSMIIDGKEYVALLKEKADAEADFEGGDGMGMSAGIEQTQQRETQWFKASVKIDANHSVIFKLRYQQMLERKLGQYEQVVFADPGLTNVGQFSVKMFISEPSGIKDLDARKPYTGTTLFSAQDEEFSLVVRKSRTQAAVSYFKANFNPPKESSRRFVVRYDVERHRAAGELWRHNGYFVHFFAPTLESLSKRVVFVVDVSGSMRGTKMLQTQAALNTIIPQLNKDDLFNIVIFEGAISNWKDGLEGIDKIDEALGYVSKLTAYGSTNFNAAVLEAIRILDETKSVDNVIRTSTIILLTDGQPTAGVTNEDLIKKNIRTKNVNNYPIFTLGFGNDADHDFLNQVALEHQGLYRKIYADSDAAEQLEGFFFEVANPLLMKLGLTYEGNVESVTKNKFLNYFKGSEIVVMGKYKTGANYTGITGNVQAIGNKGNFIRKIPSLKLKDEFGSSVSTEVTTDFDAHFERMWAYITVSQLINDEIIARNKTEIDYIQKNIVQTSLQYNYVTPFNMMIAQKPKGQSNQMTVVSTKRPPTAQGSGQRSYYRPTNYGSNAFSNLANYPSPYQQQSQQAPIYQQQSVSYGPIKLMPPNPNTTTTIPTTTTTTTIRTTTTMAPTAYPSLGSVPLNPFEFVADCGFERNIKDRVTLKSPGLVYAADSTCKWTIKNTQPNKTMEMKFMILDLEDDQDCQMDRVIVYTDVDDTKPLQYQTFCGFKAATTKPIVANKNFVVIFQTDSQVQGRGFRTIVTTK